MMVAVRVRSGRIRMASSGLLRGAGLAGLVGGILIAIVNPLGFLSGVYADTSSKGPLMLFALLVLIGIALLLLGLVGIYVSQAEAIDTSAIPGPATEVVLVLAEAWLGYYLFSGRAASVAQTPPRVS